MENEGHEQLVVCSDSSTGLKAFIAIHDRTLGPACGGCRIWPHPTEDTAIRDVLRLSKAMTYKSAAAGLQLGGGKALIIADPRVDGLKMEGLLRVFGQYVDSLGGRFIVTEDVGATPQHMVTIAKETEHVVGLPASLGGSGETSVMTALGVYLGMKACINETQGNDSLQGKIVALQGFGHVSTNLATHLIKENVQLIVTDIYEDVIERARKLGATIVKPDEIYDVECDIFSPNALGEVLNETTIPRLKCSIVAGGANNQLQTIDDADSLARTGILYAPDYIINAGGIINVSCEIGTTYSEKRARQKTEEIYYTTQRVIRESRMEGINTMLAANRLAEEKLRSNRL